MTNQHPSSLPALLLLVLLIVQLFLVFVRSLESGGRGGVQLRKDFLGQIVLTIGVEQDRSGDDGRRLGRSVNHHRVSAGFGFCIDQLANVAQNILGAASDLEAEVFLGVALKEVGGLFDFLDFHQLFLRRAFAPFALVGGHRLIIGAFDQFLVVVVGFLIVLQHAFLLFGNVSLLIVEVGVGLLGLPVFFEDPF